MVNKRRRRNIRDDTANKVRRITNTILFLFSKIEKKEAEINIKKQILPTSNCDLKGQLRNMANITQSICLIRSSVYIPPCIVHTPIFLWWGASEKIKEKDNNSTG